MFDFGNANTAQQEAIKHVDGPLLIIAGPGTGKTYTLVQRIVYMVQEKDVAPENIMVATFTEKAAKELVTRISNELMSRHISININDMYIGTFHSICLRIIKDYLEHTRLKKNFKLLDGFEQQYIVFQNIARFRKIDLLDETIEENSAWRQSKAICSIVNNLCEELVDYEQLKQDDDQYIATIGLIMECYSKLMADNNMLDFSAIQTTTYDLLNNNREILEQLQKKIRYIMVDEYQDTNYIQEQLIFMLAGKEENICVVGDDDQGLYRFRGATIRNILEFPRKFLDKACKIVTLSRNYRSDNQIVDFYNHWMATTGGARFKFAWDKFRYDKQIVACKDKVSATSTVIKVSSEGDEEDYHKTVLDFINELSKSGKLTNLNQIAFLFNSVKNPKVVALATYLEENGINVYSPRSDMFFKREEIKLIFGCLLILFPKFLNKLAKREFSFIDEKLYSYYEECTALALQELNKNENIDLLKWIRKKGKEHSMLTENTNYAFLGLLYQMFEYDRFKKYLDTGLDSGAISLRPCRNIALLTKIIGKFEYLHGISVFTSKTIDKNIERFFNLYIKLLYDGGIDEYEDDSEYAPSDCVSFLTIHQSKGMEFPIVFVGSLGNIPRNRNVDLILEIEKKYFHRSSFEPVDQIKFFDFWRLYYTAFSRAQNLLVLTCNEKKGYGAQPSMYFQDVYSQVKMYTDEKFDFNDLYLEDIKDVNLKSTYSFTSHISVYENCSLQYKFFKELGFTPIRVGATVFGMLVHQTIEDIHKSVIAHHEEKVTEENIRAWFEANYLTISESEHAYLAQAQLDAALRQVLNYAEREGKDWSRIQEAEVEVGLVKPEYILQGTIDLIKGKDDTVEIVDFKSEKKPDLFKDYERIEHYKKQLQVYAYLIEEKLGKSVSKMHLYYTGAENEIPTISFSKNKEDINKTINEFDDIVRKIQNKEFKTKAKSQDICDNCDFRHYCSN